MMFAANNPPILGERDKQAITSRLTSVKLPYTFVNNPSETDRFKKQRIPESNLEAKLLTDEALSGLLRLAVDGIQHFEMNDDVSVPETPMERLQRYERSADPIRQFGHECLKDQDSEYVVKAGIMIMYNTWAKSRGHELGPNTHQTLHDAVQGTAELNYATSRPDPADYADAYLLLQPCQSRYSSMIPRMTFQIT
ncbi:hypothetical protein [Haloquadratum walsbyi]|nr:hypothetical protein [Haloquadratum walsbyi]